MYDDIILFINLVNSGGFNKTAKKLNLQRSKVSRRIKMLEESLGGSLLKRGIKTLELTDFGSRVYTLFKEHCTTAVHILDELKSENSEPQGIVRVMLPPVLAHKITSNGLSEFLQKHPKLQVHMFYLLNVLPNDIDFFDLAISTFIPQRAHLKVRRIYTSPGILCASPNYLQQHGEPLNVEELNNHQILPHLIDGVLSRVLYIHDDKGVNYSIDLNNYQIAYDNMISLLSIAEQGYGICSIPYFIVKESLENGRLVQILPTLQTDDFSFYLIRPEQSVSRKDEAFITFIENFLQNLT